MDCGSGWIHGKFGRATAFRQRSKMVLKSQLCLFFVCQSILWGPTGRDLRAKRSDFVIQLTVQDALYPCVWMTPNQRARFGNSHTWTGEVVPMKRMPDCLAHVNCKTGRLALAKQSHSACVRRRPYHHVEQEGSDLRATPQPPRSLKPTRGKPKPTSQRKYWKATQDQSVRSHSPQTANSPCLDRRTTQCECGMWKANRLHGFLLTFSIRSMRLHLHPMVIAQYSLTATTRFVYGTLRQAAAVNLRTEY